MFELLLSLLLLPLSPRHQRQSSQTAAGTVGGAPPDSNCRLHLALEVLRSDDKITALARFCPCVGAILSFVFAHFVKLSLFGGSVAVVVVVVAAEEAREKGSEERIWMACGSVGEWAK